MEDKSLVGADRSNERGDGVHNLLGRVDVPFHLHAARLQRTPLRRLHAPPRRRDAVDDDLVGREHAAAADLAGDGYAETYTPGDVQGCEAAILRMLARPRADLQAACAEVAASGIGTMDDHFQQLFDLYVSIVEESRA